MLKLYEWMAWKRLHLSFPAELWIFNMMGLVARIWKLCIFMNMCKREWGGHSMQKIKDGFVEIFLQKHCTYSQKKTCITTKIEEFVWKRVIEGQAEKERTLKANWLDPSRASKYSDGSLERGPAPTFPINFCTQGRESWRNILHNLNRLENDYRTITLTQGKILPSFLLPGLKVSSLQSSKWVCEKATQYITLRRGDNKDDKICSQIDALWT